MLEKANIRISGVLSEIFGIAGLQILNGILNNKNIDDVLLSKSGNKHLLEVEEFKGIKIVTVKQILDILGV